MAYSALPTRTTADTASAADVNQLQDNITYLYDNTKRVVINSITAEAAGGTTSHAHGLSLTAINGISVIVLASGTNWYGPNEVAANVNFTWTANSTNVDVTLGASATDLVQRIVRIIVDYT